MADLSQRQAVLAWLETGRTLTPMQALYEFGCFRLGARVEELRRQGWNVVTEMVEVGRGKRVASYRLQA